MLRGMTALLEAIDEQAEHHAQKVQESEGFAASAAPSDGPHGALTPDGPCASPLLAVPLPPLPAAEQQSLRAELQERSELQERAEGEARLQRAAAAAARADLLRRSLEVQRLEDALRDTRAQFDAHRAHSRSLLEAKERESDALRRRLDECRPAAGAADTARATELREGSAELQEIQEIQELQEIQEIKELRAQLREFERRAAQFESEQQSLRARLASAQLEAGAARDERTSIAQQRDALAMERLGAAEALDGEVAAHRRTRDLLQCRQRELNELRAAVERGGGTFTASGALVLGAARRGDAAITSSGAIGTAAAAAAGGIELRDQQQMARQLLERQNALEAAMRDAAEWRRRYDRAAQRLQEEQARPTTRVPVISSSTSSTTVREAELRPLLRRVAYANCAARWAVDTVAVLDAAVLRVTRALMRRPFLRAAAAFYILWLHVWLVMAVVLAQPHSRAARPMGG